MDQFCTGSTGTSAGSTFELSAQPAFASLLLPAAAAMPAWPASMTVLTSRCRARCCKFKELIHQRSAVTKTCVHLHVRCRLRALPLDIVI